MSNKIVIGIDQSYTLTGISVVKNGKPIYVGKVNFKGLKTKAQKRIALKNKIQSITASIVKRYDAQQLNNTIIIMERVNTFRKQDSDGFMSVSYMLAAGAIQATIVDAGLELGVNVYSVSPQSWKPKVLGKYKKQKKMFGVKEGKEAAVLKAIQLGYGERISRKLKSGKNKGRVVYIDDMADALCIALYGFIDANKQVLKLEE